MEQLAVDVGVKYQTINKAMNKGSTSIDTLEKIAKRLGVSPAVFWEGEGALEANEPPAHYGRCQNCERQQEYINYLFSQLKLKEDEIRSLMKAIDLIEVNGRKSKLGSE